MNSIEAFRRRLSPMIHAACIHGSLPDEAICWEWVEVVFTSPIVGSGESTSWKQCVTIRVAGRQVKRLERSECETWQEELAALGDYFAVHDGGRQKVYVLRPKQAAESVSDNNEVKGEKR